MSRKPGTRRITTAGEIMSGRMETINLLNSAKEAAVKMADKNVSSLVVVDDNGSVVGIMTERDLVRRVCTKDLPSRSVTIQNVISSPIKTVLTKTPVDEAADIMLRNRLRHLVVTDDALEPVGIVSATDIVAYLRENSETAAKINMEVLEALAE